MGVPASCNDSLASPLKTSSKTSRSTSLISIYGCLVRIEVTFSLTVFYLGFHASQRWSRNTTGSLVSSLAVLVWLNLYVKRVQRGLSFLAFSFYFAGSLDFTFSSLSVLIVLVIQLLNILLGGHRLILLQQHANPIVNSRFSSIMVSDTVLWFILLIFVATSMRYVVFLSNVSTPNLLISAPLSLKCSP